MKFEWFVPTYGTAVLKGLTGRSGSTCQAHYSSFLFLSCVEVWRKDKYGRCTSKKGHSVAEDVGACTSRCDLLGTQDSRVIVCLVCYIVPVPGRGKYTSRNTSSTSTCTDVSNLAVLTAMWCLWKVLVLDNKAAAWGWCGITGRAGRHL